MIPNQLRFYRKFHKKSGQTYDTEIGYKKAITKMAEV
jgi:hypothetical protein